MVSPGLLDAYGFRFGAGARSRLTDWQRYASERKAVTVGELEMLSHVNSRMNRIRFI